MNSRIRMKKLNNNLLNGYLSEISSLSVLGYDDLNVCYVYRGKRRIADMLLHGIHGAPYAFVVKCKTGDVGVYYVKGYDWNTSFASEKRYQIIESEYNRAWSMYVVDRNNGNWVGCYTDDEHREENLNYAFDRLSHMKESS